MPRLTFETPAPLFETKALALATFATAKPRLGQAITVQIAECDSFGIRLDGDLVAALFFLELAQSDDEGRRLVEVALAVDPRGAPHMREGLAFARLIFARVLETGPVALQAMVRAGNPAGHRMARLMGFVAVAEKDGFVTYRKA
ncbi:hypothetical protein BA190_26850 [Labrys sp. WJW]|uniref:hypothetical protein n=1 Tax=Labrys sp. WJW TaxID=1737983 RepID=UPI00082A2B3E|nr:hypothetical protein [Labrys sp. WJW]OCC01834.1 hypothetical protein BA190_26850 [Labrys sp. WJW]